MKIRRYWSRQAATVDQRGESWTVTCFGASDTSPEDAERDARSRIQRVLQHFRDGLRPDRDYGYADRPLREEILKEVTEDDERVAALTRNASGSLILNTRDVLFADIDYPRRSFLDSLKSLFGAGPDPDAQIVARTREVAERNGLRLRLYRTRGGYRAIVTSRLYEAGGPKADHVLQELGSDPLYVRLCRTQESFRARLTPKAWRLDLPKPPARFPFPDTAAESAHRDWVHHYEQESARYATCRLVEEIGTSRPEPRATRIVKLHDTHALGDGDLA